MAAELKIPFGRNKGKVLSECTDSEVKWAIDAIAGKLNDEPDKPYADKDRAWLAGAKKFLETRKGGPAPKATQAEPAPNPDAAASTAPAKAAPTAMSLERLTHEPAAITARLRDYAEHYHLVTPATQVDALPIGFGVAMSLVHVNPDDSKGGPGEVYSVGGGKVGLSGNKILEIGGAAGVDFDPRECGRLDDGSDPRYCHYRAVAVVKNFDNSIRRLVGEVEIDARDGSPQIDEIIKKALAADRDPASQILELRKFILRHAETKAKCRAIASLGLKRSYHPKELTKPFAVARLMFTGHAEDPALRRELTLMNAEHAIKGATPALYGEPRALPQRPAPLPEYQGHAPPALGNGAGEHDYDYGDLGGTEDFDAEGEEKKPSEPKASAQQAQAGAQPPSGDQSPEKQGALKL